jgi:hypothetical protein
MFRDPKAVDPVFEYSRRHFLLQRLLFVHLSNPAIRRKTKFTECTTSRPTKSHDEHTQKKNTFKKGTHQPDKGTAQKGTQPQKETASNHQPKKESLSSRHRCKIHPSGYHLRFFTTLCKKNITLGESTL